MKIKITVLLILLLSFSSFLFGCGVKVDPGNEEQTMSEKTKKLIIYTTIFPIEDFTRKIGGNHVDVQSVFPPGVDAHTFEPTAKTMVDIAEADAFIYSGAGVEGFVESTIEALKNEDVRWVKASEGIELASLNNAFHNDDHDSSETGHDDHEDHEDEDEHKVHGEVDPHVWFDPILSIQLADNILSSLQELKPGAAEEFAKNHNELKNQLEQLDQEFKEIVKSSVRSEILVSHAAYGYWESRYGIHQISVTGLSPTNEPSQKDLQHIIETAKEHNLKYVLFEQNVSLKVAEMVRKELKAEALTLHNLEAITDEDLKNNEDYFSLMKRNIDTLKIALSK
jgi:zinc transport system substrate-binding protein